MPKHAYKHGRGSILQKTAYLIQPQSAPLGAKIPANTDYTHFHNADDETQQGSKKTHFEAMRGGSVSVENTHASPLWRGMCESGDTYVRNSQQTYFPHACAAFMTAPHEGMSSSAGETHFPPSASCRVGSEETHFPPSASCRVGSEETHFSMDTIAAATHFDHCATNTATSPQHPGVPGFRIMSPAPGETSREIPGGSTKGPEMFSGIIEPAGWRRYVNGLLYENECQNRIV